MASTSTGASSSTDSASLPISSTANESDIESTSDLEVEECHDQESNPVVSLLDRLKCPASAEISWKLNTISLPRWSAAVRRALLVQPSSAAAERVFSLLQLSFGGQQDNSLQDYIEASLMLQLTSDKILENMFCVFCVFSSDSFFAHALENNNFFIENYR